jgi:UDP-glucose 4-epimerase
MLVDSLIPECGGNLFNIIGIADQDRVNVADVRDQYAMNYLVKGHDVMFNLAETLSHIDSITDPLTDLEINCRSQLSILGIVPTPQPRPQNRIRRDPQPVRPRVLPAGG